MLKPKDAQLQQEQLPDRTWIKKKRPFFLDWNMTLLSRSGGGYGGW